jgi:hypothetical protein
MKSRNRGGGRLLPWAGAALLLAFVVGMPDASGARPYKPTEPPYPEGDPTADDQPSPTPKPTRPLNQVQRIPVRETSAGSTARLIWLSYVRAWIQISLR